MIIWVGFFLQIKVLIFSELRFSKTKKNRFESISGMFWHAEIYCIIN